MDAVPHAPDAPAIRLEEDLPEELLRALVGWLLDDFGGLRRTNHRFLALFDQAFVAHAMLIVQQRHEKVRRLHRKSAPMHLALWHGSIDLRPVLRAELARLLLQAPPKILCELAPHFLNWLQSAHTLQARQKLLELLLQHMGQGVVNRHRRMLKRRIMAAGSGWSSEFLPDPAEVPQDLARLAQLLAAAEPDDVEVSSVCASITEGLAALPPDEADKAWDTLGPLVGRLPHEQRADPLFAMALHVRCLSVLKQSEAFAWIQEKAAALSVKNEAAVLEGLVLSVDCLGAVGRRDWCDQLLGKVANASSTSQRLSFLPACCASLKTLAPEDREVRFAKVFELEMPAQPRERRAWLRHLSPCVEFLAKPDRPAKLKFLMESVARTQGDTEPITLQLIDQARVLDAQEAADCVSSYTKLILEDPGTDAVLLDALFATLCVPANASVLERVFEHVVDKLDSLADVVSKGFSPIGWTACLGVVAFHLRRAPVEAFGRLSDRLIRVIESKPDRHAWIHVDVMVLSQLLGCASRRFMQPEKIGGYVKRLWALSQRCGAVEGMHVSFRKRTHLLPDSDQLLATDELLQTIVGEARRGEPVHDDVRRLFASAVLFTCADNRVVACRRLIQCLYELPLMLMQKCSYDEAAPLLQIREQLLVTLPADKAVELRSLIDSLQDMEPEELD